MSHLKAKTDGSYYKILKEMFLEYLGVNPSLNNIFLNNYYF